MHPVTIRFQQIEQLDRIFFILLIGLVAVAVVTEWSIYKLKDRWPKIIWLRYGFTTLEIAYVAAGLIYLWWRFIGAWQGIYF